MIAIVPIILIFVLAFIALCNGDPSGVEAIGKVILYIGLFIGVGLIIAYVPWLLLIGIVIAIIVAIASSSSSNSHNHSSTSNNNHVDYHKEGIKIENNYIDNSKQTDFQRQLQENTKTPQQVEVENWIKEKENIFNVAKSDLSAIKRKFLDKAQRGQYTISDGKKCIYVEYYCPSLLSYIDRQYSRNPTGKMGTSSYKSNEKVSYCIGKTKEYNLYLSVIRKLAMKSNISINPVFTEKDIPHNCENRITMPYTFFHQSGLGVSSHQIKAYLKCTIKY